MSLSSSISHPARALAWLLLSGVAWGQAQAPESLASELIDRLDPRQDGWQTEVLNETAGQVLKKLGHFLEQPGTISADKLAPLLSADFVGEPFVVGAGEPGYEQAGLSVLRWSATPAEVPRMQGAQGLADGMRGLLARWEGTESVRSKLKLWRIELGEDGFETDVLVELLARGTGVVQHSASWHCAWAFPREGEELPRLAALAVEQVEEVTHRAGASLFEDCTVSVLGATPSFASQVRPGINHWTARLSNRVGMQMFGHHGLALGDANGDGLEDLYVCDAGGLPNRLYLQRADGSVEEAAAVWGVDWLDLSTSALWLDLDQDGDQDLVVSTISQLLLCANDGEGRLELVGTLKAVSEPYSMAAADYDRDGDLDLYVCGYGAGAQGAQGPHRRLGDSAVSPVPYHDANNGGTNALLRNDGEFRFKDVTRSSGLHENNTRFSFAAAWEDYDDDGDVDLYVANDFGRNNLYENQDGKFRDVAARAGVEDIASGMSVVWGDYDRDGHMDCYISNMFSAAGNRVSYQRRFVEDASGDTLEKVQRMARGNTLFRNAGDGTFRDVSEAAGVTMGRWAWSSGFADLNNDGWQDLVVTNGYFTNEDSGDL